MSTYYICVTEHATYVKEGEFFISQGGKREPWGKHWNPVEADSLTHARLIAEIHYAEKRGFRLSEMIERMKFWNLLP